MKLAKRINIYLLNLLVISIITICGIFFYVKKVSLSESTINAITSIDKSIFESILLQTKNENDLARDLHIYKLTESNIVDYARYYSASYVHSNILNKAFQNCEENEENIKVCEKKGSNRLVSFIPLIWDETQNLGYLSLEKEKNLDELSITYLNNIILSIIFSFFIIFIFVNFLMREVLSEVKEVHNAVFDLSYTPKKSIKSSEFRDLLQVFKDSMEKEKANEDLKARLEYAETWRIKARRFAHDIRRPVKMLRSVILESKNNLNNEQTELFNLYTDNIIETANTALNVKFVDDTQAQFDLKNCITDIIKSYTKLLVNGQKLIFNDKIDSENLLITGEKILFINCFKNIIDNSIDETAKMGGAIEVQLNQNKDNFVITISDNGRGIGENDCDSIGKEGFTTKKDGHGVGLNSAFASIKKFGGEIVFDKTYINGASFKIFIPKILKKLDIA